MREGGTLYFLHADHLGSATLTTDAGGHWVGKARYTPYGEMRRDYPRGVIPTDRRYTGQRWDEGLGLYDYRARYYSPGLGRFLSPDTIVPSPGNPSHGDSLRSQSLNRYAYVLNNPLRYTDPTGMFSDDAIQAYLKATYGDAWEQYWMIWSGDQAWLDLLHAAQGGDILSRASWNNGSLHLDHFVLAGSGHDVLAGVHKAQSLTTMPQLQDPERAPLQGIYQNQGAGLSVLHFTANGTVSVAGQMGDISVSLRPVGRDDVRAQNIGHWLIITGLGKACPLLGLTLGAIKAFAGPEIGELPGMQTGDIRLTMGLSVDLGEVIHVSAYETILRQGENLGRNGVWDGITAIDRPKTWHRRN